jgi:hypothetical protein
VLIEAGSMSEQCTRSNGSFRRELTGIRADGERSNPDPKQPFGLAGHQMQLPRCFGRPPAVRLPPHAAQQPGV